MLLLISVTLATGLSWFALMERIGRVVAYSSTAAAESKRRADEWQRARALREERERSPQN